MKKALIILSIAFLLSGVAHAKVKLGVRAGLNIAKLELTEDGQSIDTRSALGLHIGGFAQLRPKSFLIIQPELLYSQKGTDAFVDDVVTIDYIVLPVLVKADVTIPGVKGIRFQPLIAPEMGYAIKAVSTFNDTFYENINKLNAGINFGLDLAYTEEYFIGLRYYLGLTDLLNDRSKRPPISNTCWTFSVGYIF